MFDLGWSEMLLIGIVALIVVGPKELPGLFRSIGVWVGKARGVAREFTRAMEAAADETGMKDIDRTIRAAANPVKFGTNSLRNAALGEAKVPPAGTPLNPGAPVAPGTATAELAAKQAENRVAMQAAAAERRIAEAERRAAEAERRAAAAEKRAAGLEPKGTDPA